ncbi:MAG TPA: CheR family methyltransferase [Holophaga sp.]|nr:CheR family methyltransferase [Holophaga sp.]HPS67299.1 CheR family methyltransferase [Holophaga sp.]
MTRSPSMSPAVNAQALANGGFAPISDEEFKRFQRLVLQNTGITLSDQKKALVVGRLGSRLRHRKADSFTAYYKLLQDPGESDELQTAIDLITTNETSFFREADHFNVLRDYVHSLRPVPFPFRVWSAASSSGEEAYTIAMVLSDILASAEWDVVGTDISTRVLERARKGLYPMERAATIPQDYLRRFCLKGQDRHEGLFLMSRQIRERVTFTHANLCKPLPRLGPFDVAFLRNVLIYFDLPQKKLVVEAVVNQLKPGGLLIVGHSENLTGIRGDLTVLKPTVYRIS